MTTMENPYHHDYPKPPDLLIEITALRSRLHREREAQDRRLDQLTNAVVETITRRYRGNDKTAPVLPTPEPLRNTG
jgi:hypothetical protein